MRNITADLSDPAVLTVILVPPLGDAMLTPSAVTGAIVTLVNVPREMEMAVESGPPVTVMPAPAKKFLAALALLPCKRGFGINS